MFGHNKQPGGPEKLKPKTSEKKDKLPSYLKEEEKPTFFDFDGELGKLEEERAKKKKEIDEALDAFSKE